MKRIAIIHEISSDEAARGPSPSNRYLASPPGQTLDLGIDLESNLSQVGANV